MNLVKNRVGPLFNDFAVITDGGKDELGFIAL